MFIEDAQRLRQVGAEEGIARLGDHRVVASLVVKSADRGAQVVIAEVQHAKAICAALAGDARGQARASDGEARLAKLKAAIVFRLDVVTIDRRPLPVTLE